MSSEQQTELAIWQDKYSRIHEQYLDVVKINASLEDKVLNNIEKTERDKITLSEEIDDLSARLADKSNKIVFLEQECARYKSDCVLAVHLLHCQPSNYVAQKLKVSGLEGGDHVIEMDMASSLVHKDSRGATSDPGKMVSVPSLSNTTFPPTAFFYSAVHDPQHEDLSAQPEDPAPESSVMHQGTGPTAKTDGTMTKEFLDKIESQPDYQCAELRQCRSCGTSISVADQSTQADLPISQSALAKKHVTTTYKPGPAVHTSPEFTGFTSYYNGRTRMTSADSNTSSETQI